MKAAVVEGDRWSRLQKEYKTETEILSAAIKKTSCGKHRVWLKEMQLKRKLLHCELWHCTNSEATRLPLFWWTFLSFCLFVFVFVSVTRGSSCSAVKSWLISPLQATDEAPIRVGFTHYVHCTFTHHVYPLPTIYIIYYHYILQYIVYPRCKVFIRIKSIPLSKQHKATYKVLTNCMFLHPSTSTGDR